MSALAQTSNVGQRVHRVIFQNPGASVSDNDAGFTAPWLNATPSTMYVRIRAATANDLERVAAGTVLSQASHIVDMPYHPQVTTQTRILFNGRTFNVVGVSNPEERNISLTLTVSEVVT